VVELETALARVVWGRRRRLAQAYARQLRVDFVGRPTTWSWLVTRRRALGRCRCFGRDDRTDDRAQLRSRDMRRARRLEPIAPTLIRCLGSNLHSLPQRRQPNYPFVPDAKRQWPRTAWRNCINWRGFVDDKSSVNQLAKVSRDLSHRHQEQCGKRPA